LDQIDDISDLEKWKRANANNIFLEPLAEKICRGTDFNPHETTKYIITIKYFSNDAARLFIKGDDLVISPPLNQFGRCFDINLGDLDLVEKARQILNESV